MSGRHAALRTTAIPGLLVLDLVLHDDARGWFKENWQRARMTELGLPDFVPVQHSLAMNERAGVTRGLHAEPWDKLVSLAQGRVFAAWVDLRAGATFGVAVTLELGPETAVFVPRGVANGYQSLQDHTVYSYLVNEHWSRDRLNEYSYVNAADASLDIRWPIPLADAIMSDADVSHPMLAEVRPVGERPAVVVGADGQLGRELLGLLPDAVGLRRRDLDLCDPASFATVDWSRVATIINAAAFTAVDDAETTAGRRAAWAANVTGVAALCREAAAHRIPLVHVSSDYVFDGVEPEHDEVELPSPLGVYGQTKAAGDALVAQLDRHLVVRTSWLIGGGRNFVSTMIDLALRGVSPAVVNDQFGRLTFVADLAAGMVHLIDSEAPAGTWNLTNSGPVQSWADIAGDVFEMCGRSREDVRGVSTDEYAAVHAHGQPAPRPRNSALRLDRIRRSGFSPPSAAARLQEYVAGQLRARQ